MAQKRLIFVTGNQNKLREAKEILGAAVPWLESRSIDCTWSWRVDFGCLP